MQTSSPSRDVPYEILRRSDGMIALGITLGHLGFLPVHMIVKQRDCLWVADKEKTKSVLMNQLPKDVLRWIEKNHHIRLYEFSSQKKMIGHDLNVLTAAL